MIIVAVQILVMDPTWNTESVVTGTWVAAFSTPCAARTSCPSDQMPSAAPGMFASVASSLRRAVQLAALSMICTLIEVGGADALPGGQHELTETKID